GADRIPGLGKTLPDPPLRRLEDPFERGENETVLGLEVVEEQALGHPGLGGDLLQWDAVDPVPRHHLVGGPDHRRPSILRPWPRRDILGHGNFTYSKSAGLPWMPRAGWAIHPANFPGSSCGCIRLSMYA